MKKIYFILPLLLLSVILIPKFSLASCGGFGSNGSNAFCNDPNTVTVSTSTAPGNFNADCAFQGTSGSCGMGTAMNYPMNVDADLSAGVNYSNGVNGIGDYIVNGTSTRITDVHINPFDNGGTEAKDFNIQASNDYVTWTTLTGTLTLPQINNQDNHYSFTNPNYYRYYRFHFINSYVGSQYLGLNYITGFCNTNQICYSTSTFPAPVSLTANILYPQNSTSTFIHDFNYFTFEATNTTDISRTYNFRITYDTTSTFSNLAQNVSRNISYVFPPGTTHFLNIPKPQYLATSTTYYAQLCAIIGPGPEYTTSCIPTITFKTGDYPLGYQINTENGGFFNSTTTESGILSASTTLDISNANYQYCDNEFYNPATWGCYAGQFLINSWNTFKNFAISFFQNAVDEIQQVFPLNVLSKVNQDFANIESTSTETNFVMTGTSTHNVFGNRNFTYLTTSTLANGTLKNAVNFDWEQLVVYLLYALTGIVMILTGYVLLHSSSEQK